MVSLGHMATNRPKKKWDDKWDGPLPVLKVYKGAVIIDLPESIKVDNSFHTSKVCLYEAPAIQGQDEINTASGAMSEEELLSQPHEVAGKLLRG